MGFAFELKQEVSINSTGEVGIVVGRTEYVANLDFENYYCLRMTDIDGCARDTWRPESAIREVFPETQHPSLKEAPTPEDEEL